MKLKKYYGNEVKDLPTGKYLLKTWIANPKTYAGTMYNDEFEIVVFASTYTIFLTLFLIVALILLFYPNRICRRYFTLSKNNFNTKSITIQNNSSSIILGIELQDFNGTTIHLSKPALKFFGGFQNVIFSLVNVFLYTFNIFFFLSSTKTWNVFP